MTLSRKCWTNIWMSVDKGSNYGMALIVGSSTCHGILNDGDDSEGENMDIWQLPLFLLLPPGSPPKTTKNLFSQTTHLAYICGPSTCRLHNMDAFFWWPQKKKKFYIFLEINHHKGCSCSRVLNIARGQRHKGPRLLSLKLELSLQLKRRKIQFHHF